MTHLFIHRFVSVFLKSAALLAVSLQPFRLHAGTPQPGTLDSSFGDHGIAFIPLPAVNYGPGHNPICMLLDLNDNIYVGGSYEAGARDDIFVLRLLPDGNLDEAYGNSGVTKRPVGIEGDYILSITLQDDEKIVAGGYSEDNPLTSGKSSILTRFNTDGSLDTSFGSSGIVTFKANNAYNSDFSSLVLQPDHKILAAGNSNFGILARFDSSGKLDTTFGRGGFIMSTGTAGGAGNVLLQSDGNIVVIEESSFDARGIVIQRFTSSGALDITFNEIGIVKMRFGTGDRRTDFTGRAMLQNDDKIVISGRSENSSTFESNYFVSRINADGSLDRTFGGNGIVRLEVPGLGGSTDVLQQADGKLVFLASAQTGRHYQSVFYVVRLNGDGTLDTTFGDMGAVKTQIEDLDCYGFSIAIQRNGDIVAAGRAIQGIAVVRFQGQVWPVDASVATLTGITHGNGTVNANG